jgi:putative flippase GtrA
MLEFKINSLTRQFFKYCISGGIGAGIDFFLFSMLVTLFHIDFIISNTISFSLGTIVVCYMQKKWTFQYTSDETVYLYTKYLLSIGIIFLFNNILLIFFIGIVHFREIMAKFFQIILSSIVGYLIQKTFVFTKLKRSAIDHN